MTLDLALTEAAIRESVVANLANRDVVVVKGADAASFLHGQLSQNVERLAIGDSAPSFLLHPQGKVAAWGRVSRVGDEEYWFDVDPGYGPDAADRLQRFLLRVRCTVESFSWPVVQLRGPDAKHLDGSLPAAIGSATIGYDLLGPEAQVPDGVAVGDAEAFVAHRIELRWPAMGAEITESTIPAEVGIVEESADFTKGCYVGQELVARVDSRGSNTPRKMHCVSGQGEKPEVSSDLVVDGDVIGVLTSAASVSTGGWVGLASIKRSAETPCVATAQGQSLEVHAID